MMYLVYVDHLEKNVRPKKFNCFNIKHHLTFTKFGSLRFENTSFVEITPDLKFGHFHGTSKILLLLHENKYSVHWLDCTM